MSYWYKTLPADFHCSFERLKNFFQILEIKMTSAKKWRVGRFPFPDAQPVSESSCNSHCRWNAAKNDLRDNFKSWLHFRSHDLQNHIFKTAITTDHLPDAPQFHLFESWWRAPTKLMDRYVMRWQSSANCFIGFQREMKKDNRQLLFFWSVTWRKMTVTVARPMSRRI